MQKLKLGCDFLYEIIKLARKILNCSFAMAARVSINIYMFWNLSHNITDTGLQLLRPKK